MRVLIVEDEKHMIAELSERLIYAIPRIHLVVAGSRSSGVAALQNEDFDFIVCDLRLPPHDGGLDTDEAHGLSVHSAAKEICPGTPCLFFTGFDTSKAVREELSAGGTQDVLGTGQGYGMTRLLTKDDLLECVERIEEFNSELEVLDTRVCGRAQTALHRCLFVAIGPRDAARDLSHHNRATCRAHSLTPTAYPRAHHADLDCFPRCQVVSQPHGQAAVSVALRALVCLQPAPRVPGDCNVSHERRPLPAAWTHRPL